MKPLCGTIFLLLTLAAGMPLLKAQKGNINMPKKGLCAHRGGMDTHPENTRPAFRYAAAAGVQMIEFDIQFSKDSALVIMHDETVDRTTDGKGSIADLTLAEIRQLDAGNKKGAQWAGTRVPTLEETLAVMPRNIWLNCHLKGDSALGKAVAQVIERTNRKHQTMLTGSEAAAAGARSVVPDILICNADNRYRKDNRQYTEATLAMKAPFIQLVATGTAAERQPYINQLKAGGVKINFFAANLPEEAAPLWKAGIDFLLVNDLPAFLPEMKKAGIRPVKPQY